MTTIPPHTRVEAVRDVGDGLERVVGWTGHSWPTWPWLRDTRDGMDACYVGPALGWEVRVLPPAVPEDATWVVCTAPGGVRGVYPRNDDGTWGTGRYTLADLAEGGCTLSFLTDCAPTPDRPTDQTGGQ